MGKQPYIPFYIGDYLKDTRILPLSVRGAWVDLILFMWDSPTRGEITGTLKEIARMIGCDTSEAQFALDLLKQKNTAIINLLPSGEYQIISRRMKKDAEISAIRSKVGKKGVEAKKNKEFAEPKAKAKQKQNTEYDNDNEIEFTNKGDLFKKLFSDEIWIEQLKITHRGKDLNQAWEECYSHHSANPNAKNWELWEWRQKLNTWLTIKKNENIGNTTKFTGTAASKPFKGTYSERL